jgi:hypothetical protein
MSDDIQTEKSDSLISVHRFIETGRTRRIRWLSTARGGLAATGSDAAGERCVKPDLDGVYQICDHPQWRARADDLRRLIARHRVKI